MRINTKSHIVLYRSKEGDVAFYLLSPNKFIAGLLGLALFNWAGLLSGFLIGSALDCRFHPNRKTKKDIDLRTQYLMLGIYVLQFTGAFSVLPLAEILRRFNAFLGPDYISRRIRMMEDLSKQRIQVEAACAFIEQKASVQQIDQLLNQLHQLCNHPLIDASKRNAAIARLANRFKRGIPVNDPPPVSKPTPHPSARWYLLLQCKPGDSFETVKKAYYRLAKEHHPDRNHQNPDSLVRFREIKDAYEKLKNLNNWK